MSAYAYSEWAFADALKRLLDARLTKQVRVATPAVGAEWTQTVPGGEIWFPRSLVVTFTASAVVVNRDPKVVMDDGTTIFNRTIVRSGVVASTTAQLSWFTSAGVFAADVATTGQVGSLYDGPLPNGCRIRSITTSLDVGDAYSGIVLTVLSISASDLATVGLDIAGELAENYGS